MKEDVVYWDRSQRQFITEDHNDNMVPVPVLLYRSSYGSTDCDALCQVSPIKKPAESTPKKVALSKKQPYY